MEAHLHLSLFLIAVHQVLLFPVHHRELAFKNIRCAEVVLKLTGSTLYADLHRHRKMEHSVLSCTLETLIRHYSI